MKGKSTVCRQITVCTTPNACFVDMDPPPPAANQGILKSFPVDGKEDRL